jgi:hypothetical protein
MFLTNSLTQDVPAGRSVASAAETLPYVRGLHRSLHNVQTTFCLHKPDISVLSDTKRSNLSN